MEGHSRMVTYGLWKLKKINNMKEPLRILFKFPCRYRKDMFFKSLDSLNDNIRDRNNYHIGLTLDTDDNILNTPQVIEKLSTYPNVSIQWGLSGSKISAINRSMPDYDFDLIICWSQDMFAEFYGFDDIIRAECYNINNQHGDDFLYHLPEPDSREMLNVLYIATRKYFDRFGYIYHSSYQSLFCDNETMCVAKMLGRYFYSGTMGLYSHRNPAYHQYNLEKDDLFLEQQGLWGVDEANFHARRKINFDLKEEEIVDKYYLSQTFPYT